MEPDKYYEEMMKFYSTARQELSDEEKSLLFEFCHCEAMGDLTQDIDGFEDWRSMKRLCTYT